MKLARLEISNYRSIKQLDMDFGASTIIVGKNNTGKSNILRAIDIVLGERFFKPTKNDFFDGDETRTIQIILHFDDFTDEEINEITSKIKYPCYVEHNYYRAIDYTGFLYATRSARLEIEMSNVGLEKKLYLGGVYYKYLSTELKNAIITSVHIPSVRDHTQILKTTDYSFLGKLLAKLYDGADATKKTELNQKLSEGNDVCNDIFLKYQNRLNEISSAIISHNGVKFSFLPSNPRESYRKLEILLDDGIETGLDFKGSGIQSVIIISLFKLYSEVKAGQALILIEEPELFLHPHANRHMASVLKDFCTSEGVQLIITTHSPQYLLDRDISEIVLVRKVGKETSVKRATGAIDEVKLKKELSESNLELFFSEKVVLVEGQSDKIMLQAFAKSIDDKFDFDAKNIGVIETGSKANLDIFIDLLEAFEVPWLAVVDKDLLDDKGTLGRMNTHFNLGIVDTDSSAQKSDTLKAKGINVLQFGEIENYYNKDWLYNVLYDFIDETNLPQKTDIKTLIQNMTSSDDSASLKRQLGTSGWLTLDIDDVVNRVINCKVGLIPVNMEAQRLGNKLQDEIFSCFQLTKPKIALKIKKYVNVNSLPDNKKEELTELLSRVFAT